ncbi:MAG TPA: hypothetical protein VF194_08680 [Ferrovibrio sp.]|jgi:hypothetical protein|uniref:hypothetical protein n=1 Tax=Ferrovibrio sp. TaxID=1917215 RepID=UPI002ED3E87D
MSTEFRNRPQNGPAGADEARRKFLAICGKFAVATPPAITLILAESERNFAVAGSGHGGGRHHTFHPNNGFGNGPFDGVPGRSHHSDHNR